MKRALVDKMGRVVQVVEAGQEFPVHPDLAWKDCADDVKADGHIWDGAKFNAKPAAAAFQESGAKASARAKLKALGLTDAEVDAL